MSPEERKKKIESLRKRIDKLMVELGNVKADCMHESTTPGIFGYDYKPSTHMYDICNICGSIINSRYVEH